MSDELTLYRHASGKLYCEGMTCMHGECERRKDVRLKRLKACACMGDVGRGLLDKKDNWALGLINKNDDKQNDMRRYLDEQTLITNK